MTPSTMSNHTELITTRLSSGTYIAKSGHWKCSSTSSHQQAADNFIAKYLGGAFVAVRSPSQKGEVAKPRVRFDWEWEVFRIESI